MKIFFTILLFIGIFACGIWFEVFKYKDCKKVGHSKLYCILKINS